MCLLVIVEIADFIILEFQVSIDLRRIQTAVAAFPLPQLFLVRVEIVGFWIFILLVYVIAGSPDFEVVWLRTERHDGLSTVVYYCLFLDWTFVPGRGALLKCRHSFQSKRLFIWADIWIIIMNEPSIFLALMALISILIRLLCGAIKYRIKRLWFYILGTISQRKHIKTLLPDNLSLGARRFIAHERTPVFHYFVFVFTDLFLQTYKVSRYLPLKAQQLTEVLFEYHWV